MLDFYLRRILLHSVCMREYGNSWPWNCVVPKLRVAYTPISAFAVTIQFPWKTIDAKAIDDSSTISCSEDANETTTPRSRTRNPVPFFLSLSSAYVRVKTRNWFTDRLPRGLPPRRYFIDRRTAFAFTLLDPKINRLPSNIRTCPVDQPGRDVIGR